MTLLGIYSIGLAIIIGLMILLWVLSLYYEKFQYCGYFLGCRFCDHGLGVLPAHSGWISHSETVDSPFW